MSSKVIGFIFARGGSKGVPRKNIRPLASKPLIAWAIECGLESRLVDRVVVSTDNAEIAETAKRFGAEVPFMRPAELAGDRSPEWLAWRHAIEAIREHPDFGPFETFASIPTTSPLRRAQDLDQCIEALRDSRADLIVTVKEAARNPYFNQVVLDNGRRASLVIPPPQGVHFRQTAPKVYDMTTVAYAARPDYVLKAESMFQGEVRAIIIPVERALDIDSELDFQIAEFLMNKKGKNP
jgi:N,N'-diacetyl-8-epilegionaminate cytidylyltransferase